MSVEKGLPFSALKFFVFADRLFIFQYISMMNENSEKGIARTIDEGKNFIHLVKNYSKMVAVEKGSSILSTVILIIVVISIATIAVFCLCMACYHWLKSKNNDPVLSFSIIAIGLLFLCTLIILLKKTLIESPVIKMLNKKLSDKDNFENIVAVKTQKDVLRQKSSLMVDIKKSGKDLKSSAKDTFSPKRETAGGSKLDFNKLVLYAVFAYKGIVWTNKIRRFLGKGKSKGGKKRR